MSTCNYKVSCVKRLAIGPGTRRRLLWATSFGSSGRSARNCRKWRLRQFEVAKSSSAVKLLSTSHPRHRAVVSSPANLASGWFRVARCARNASAARGMDSPCGSGRCAHVTYYARIMILSRQRGAQQSPAVGTHTTQYRTTVHTLNIPCTYPAQTLENSRTTTLR